MKEHKVEVDLNQMTTPELDFMIDILYGKDNEAVKYIMDLKAFRNGWMCEEKEKEFGEKYIKD